FNDYDRELALVAERRDAKTGEREILGVGRLSKQPWRNEAEFAVLVSDEWQNRGLGTQFLRQIVAVAKAEHLSRLSADILPDNTEMQRVAEKLGFTLERDLEEANVKAELSLG